MREQIEKILTKLWSRAFEAGANYKIGTGSLWKDATDEALTAILALKIDEGKIGNVLSKIVIGDGVALSENEVEYFTSAIAKEMRR